MICLVQWASMKKISMRTKRKKNKIYCGWLLSAAFLLHKNATEIFSPWRFSLGGIALLCCFFCEVSCVELIILALFGNKLVMCATLDYPALLKYHYAV